MLRRFFILKLKNTVIWHCFHLFFHTTKIFSYAALRPLLFLKNVMRIPEVQKVHSTVLSVDNPLKTTRISPATKKVLSYSEKDLSCREKSSLLQRRKFSSTVKKDLSCSEERSHLQWRKFSPAVKKIISCSEESSLLQQRNFSPTAN